MRLLETTQCSVHDTNREVSEGPEPDSTRIYCRTPGDPLFLLGKGDKQYSSAIEINNETIPRLFHL